MALTETAKTDESWQCSIKVADYDSSKKYAVYTNVDGEWVYKGGYISENGYLTFDKNDNSYTNEYAVVNIYDDGTVTSICDESIFTLNHIVPPVVTDETDANNYTATLRWKAVDGAEKYNIYFEGEKIATVDNTKTSYKTGKLKTERQLRYSVSAVKGNTELLSYNVYVYIHRRPIVKANARGSGIRVSWDGSGHEYFVYRKTSADGEWKLVKKTTDYCWDDVNLENGKTYYYKVSTNGRDSENIAKITYVRPTVINSASIGKKSVVIKWTRSDVADYYIVYKATGSSWKEVYRTKDANTVKYTDTDVKSGKKYSYRVYAVKNGSKSAYASKSVTFVAPPTGLKATAVSSGVKISFKKVEGAKKYVIYRKSGKGEYEKLKTLKSSSLSYTDKNIKKGTKYTYYVKAYNGSLYSAASSKVSFKKK